MGRRNQLEREVRLDNRGASQSLKPIMSSTELVGPTAFPESRERGFPIPKDELAAFLVPFTRHGAGF